MRNPVEQLLRDYSLELRRKPLSLGETISVLQKGADEIGRLAAAPQVEAGWVKVPKELIDLSEKATQGEWAIYDSNSWRRFGLAGDYKEFLWPCIAKDGHVDLSGLNREDDLAFITALVNWFRSLPPASEK